MASVFISEVNISDGKNLEILEDNHHQSKKPYLFGNKMGKIIGYK